MRTFARDGEAFYNERLSRELKAAYERSEIGPKVLGALIDCKPGISYKYVTLDRSIVRSDVERKAVVTIKLLNDMCDKGILPIRGLAQKHPKRPAIVMEVIEKYMNTLHQ